MQFAWRRFEDLSAAELYALLAFRQDVFIVEQSSPYRDLDFLDQTASHLLASSDDGALAGYTRCLGPRLDVCPRVPHASIGRVVVGPAARGSGLGRALITRSIDHLAAAYPDADIVIGAQAHLERFYGAFGFVREGEVYDDGGIPHYHMRRGHMRRSATPRP